MEKKIVFSTHDTGIREHPKARKEKQRKRKEKYTSICYLGLGKHLLGHTKQNYTHAEVYSPNVKMPVVQRFS